MWGILDEIQKGPLLPREICIKYRFYYITNHASELGTLNSHHKLIFKLCMKCLLSS
jgi:hypothetical protein